jgi:tetratricopeptide (TPR) repeat protein
MAEGDELFRAQNFHFALQKYKLAASAAPNIAECFWRKGHALVATHNYELAAAAFKRAIGLSRDISRGGFRLGELYGGAAMTKFQHLEFLAEWTLARGNSPDGYFLVGLFLHYDGHQPRAEKFFAQAAELAGPGADFLAAYLRSAGNDPIPPPPPVARTRPPLTPASTGIEL